MPEEIPRGVAITATVAGSVSFVCCVVTLFTYGVVVKPRTTLSTLLLVLTGADICQAAFFMLTFAEFPGYLCTIQSLFGIVTASASFLLTLCLAIYVLGVLRGAAEHARPAEPTTWWLYAISFGYPLSFAVTLVAIHPHMDMHDAMVPWCFIPSSRPVWRLFSVYLPLFVAWVGTGVCYVLSRRALSGAISTELRSRPHAKFVAIPLIFVLLRVWGAILRLLELTHNGGTPSHTTWLLYLTALGDPSQGTANCIVFVACSSKVMRHARLWWGDRRGAGEHASLSPVKAERDNYASVRHVRLVNPGDGA